MGDRRRRITAHGLAPSCDKRGVAEGNPTPIGNPCILCVSQLSLKHDAARVVQSCVKYGSSEHRTAVVSELRGEQSLVGHVTRHVQQVDSLSILQRILLN